jgi:hypothetical protein
MLKLQAGAGEQSGGREEVVEAWELALGDVLVRDGKILLGLTVARLNRLV